MQICRYVCTYIEYLYMYQVFWYWEGCVGTKLQQWNNDTDTDVQQHTMYEHTHTLLLFVHLESNVIPSVLHLSFPQCFAICINAFSIGVACFQLWFPSGNSQEAPLGSPCVCCNLVAPCTIHIWLPHAAPHCSLLQARQTQSNCPDGSIPANAHRHFCNKYSRLHS
jgi:hypothetical protein